MYGCKRRLAFLAIPATLALGAVTYGSVVAMASQSPSPTSTAQPSTAEPGTEKPDSATEQPETAAEGAEPNEPALPKGGHADDPDNAQADTEQEGVH